MIDKKVESELEGGWKGLLFRWSIAVAVTCGPLLLLGASWTVVGVVFGVEVIGLFVLIWDCRNTAPYYGPVSQWYHVEWNDERILLDVQSKNPWRAETPWEAIRSICLEMSASPLDSDTVFIFVDGRESPFPIAFEADNGHELVKQLPRRGLFPAKLMVEAMGGLGEVFCHDIREDTGERHPMLEEVDSSTGSQSRS